MNLENVVTILGLLGLGGLLGNYFRILWERQNKALLQKQEFKETRYKCIIVLLMCYMDFDKNKQMLHLQGRSYIESIDDLKYDLKLEWNNMILYGSAEVLETTYDFLSNPSEPSFRNVALAM